MDELKDRIEGAVLRALIGDAPGLGPHWCHAGLHAGDLSQTREVILLLLRSVAAAGGYDQADFTRLLDQELLPRLTGESYAGPGGFTNQSFRELCRACRAVPHEIAGPVGGVAIPTQHWKIPKGGSGSVIASRPVVRRLEWMSPRSTETVGPPTSLMITIRRVRPSARLQRLGSHQHTGGEAAAGIERIKVNTVN